MILETKYSVGDKVAFKVKPDGEIMCGEIVRVSVTQGDYKRYPNEEIYTIFDGNKYYSIVVLGIVGVVIEEPPSVYEQ